jgi:hypothetical protein
VLIGAAPDGTLVGQEVADITLRDIAAMLGRFEPRARVSRWTAWTSETGGR